MTQRILVQFEGEGAGTGELTWGQQASWGSMRGTGTSDNIGGTMPLAEGTTVEEIVHVLRFIMSRHQSLRTRLRFDADGEPTQVVSASGEIALEIVDVPDSDDPAQVAEELRERYESTNFNLEMDWPVRMAVLRHHGVPVHFTVMYTHLAIDGYGFEALVADLAHLDRATGRQLAPVAGIQPLELARMQRTPAARRQHDASLRHWERQLRAIAPRRFRDSPDKRDPRYWEASYSSPAAYLALASIAARTKVHTGPILLAAYAVSLGRLTGFSPSVIRTLVSNRFRPGFAESVTAMIQGALCVVDVADTTFDDVVARAWRSQLAAGMHAYYDPRQLWALIDRVNAERGVELDLMCYFNDRRRSLAQAAPDIEPSREHLREALPLSRLRWGGKSNNPDATAYLHINSVPDTLDYTLRVDTHCVTPAELEWMLREFESVLVCAAFDPAAPTGVQPVPAELLLGSANGD